MHISYVVLSPANLDLLENLAPDVFDEAIDPARLSAYLGVNTHCLILALQNELVVGHARAVIHMHPDLPNELYIDNLGVTPSLQRQGIATRLIKELRAFGRRMGCQDIWVATEADNHIACAFYEATGLRKNLIHMYDGKV
jgi:ribosomal protein S18 acetylase RimI-like enzyme